MHKSVSNKTLDKTMSFILDHEYLSDKDINKLTSTSEARKALTTLKAMKAIDYKTSMSGNFYGFKVLDDEILYFYKKHQERIGFWKGFVVGILSAAVATLVANLIMALISRL